MIYLKNESDESHWWADAEAILRINTEHCKVANFVLYVLQIR